MPAPVPYITHTSPVPTRKIGLGVGGGGGGAVVLVWLWNGMIASWLALPEMPAEVAAPIVVGIAFGIGWLLHDRERADAVPVPPPSNPTFPGDLPSP